MKKYMLEYLDDVEKQMSDSDTDYSKLLSDFKVHLEFFQHERLIHLIVTVLFSIITILSIGADVFNFNPAVFLLSIIFFVMTIFYVAHYYFLENTVQKMYRLYDTIRDTINDKKGVWYENL